MSLINHKNSFYINIQLKVSNNKDFINNKEISDWIYRCLSNYNHFICNIYIYITNNDIENINILIFFYHFNLIKKTHNKKNNYDICKKKSNEK